jgi:hypothetical protein
MCIWGHPSTTGLPSMDYYLSSSLYYEYALDAVASNELRLPFEDELSTDDHNEHQLRHRDPQSFFTEQLVLFDTLGFWFNRPTLYSALGLNSKSAMDQLVYQNMLAERPPSFYSKLHLHVTQQVSSDVLHADAARMLISLIDWKTSSPSHAILLCPQSLPKFHPAFDRVLLSSLVRNSNVVLVLLGSERRTQWKKMLLTRWKSEIMQQVEDRNDDNDHHQRDVDVDEIMSHIHWLPSLSPEQYLMLLSLGDVMLDPFPFGGGVTMLEALAVCTPPLTLPHRQNVPQLAAGMVNHLHLAPHIQETLVAHNELDFVEAIAEMVSAQSSLRAAICSNAHNLFRQVETVQEWELFLQRASTTKI